MRVAWLVLCGQLAFAVPVFAQSVQPPTTAALKEPVQTAQQLQEFLKSPAYSQTYEEKVLAPPTQNEPTGRLLYFLKLLELLYNSKWVSWVATLLKGLLLLLLAWFLYKLYGYRHYLIAFVVRQTAKKSATAVSKNQQEEPLPSHDNIAQEAQKKLKKGDAVAALSLLYRGSLRAAGMTYAIHIGKDKTELVCQTLMSSLSNKATLAYFTKLSEAWIQAAYAFQSPTFAQIDGLIQGFDEAWSGHV